RFEFEDALLPIGSARIFESKAGEDFVLLGETIFERRSPWGGPQCTGRCYGIELFVNDASFALRFDLDHSVEETFKVISSLKLTDEDWQSQQWQYGGTCTKVEN